MMEGAKTNPHLAAFNPWRLVIESVLDYAIFILDTEGRVATWNRGAQIIKGYSEDEIIGQHFSRFYLPADVAAGKPEQELERARRDGRAEDEGWRVRKDGTRFWANVVVTALRDADGALFGFAKVARDLSARIETEEALRRSEERFRVLVESVEEYAIYMLDPAGRITTWNRGAEKLKGYRTEEIIGKEFEVFFPAEDVAQGRPRRELEIAKREGRFEDEGWRVRKDGTRFWANVVVTPILDKQGVHVGFAKVTRDLSARLEAERTSLALARAEAAREAAEKAEGAVRRAMEVAEQANRVKDEFLATVSHELRTPLSAILGWASVLQTFELEGNAGKAASAIQRNALAQRKIIDDILDVSRIITGKLQLDLRPVDLVAVLNDAIEVVRPSLSAKQMSITFKPQRPLYMVLADPDRLLQIVWNLLSNAVKFSSTGDRVTVQIEPRVDELAVTVSDTGGGVDPELLPLVFDRFKQGDSSSTRRHGGLGLGLSIVRHLVELHGGRVQARSAGLGRGAAFTFILPYRQETESTGQHARPEQSELRAAMDAAILQGVRVVVADDDDDARELVRVVLARAGAELRVAASASDAFQAVRTFRPHVLVSDIAMPDEDGYSLIRRVRQLDAAEGGGIPSIALTAYASESDRGRALSMGFSTHIAKPLQPGLLVTAVANLAALGKAP